MSRSFYSEEELKELGFQSYGSKVLISRKSSIYGASSIRIGNNVRIDDFCILSGRITIGDNVHIAAYSALYGGESGIQVDDFANISSRVCIYALSDDYSGYTMTNPTIPIEYKMIKSEKVVVERHVIIGSGSVVLPGVILREGTAIGALSLCKNSTECWRVYAGIPAKIVKERSKELLKLEQDYLKSLDREG